MGLESVRVMQDQESTFLLSTQDFDREKEKPTLFEFKTKIGVVDATGAGYSRKLFVHALASLFVAAHLCANLSYIFHKGRLYWKYSSHVLESPWLLLVLCLECLYFFSNVVASIDSFLPPIKRPEIQLDGHYYPTVHIFIPCCKEPTDVPKESVLAAMALDYPKDRFKVLVLDDGGDDDLKAFSEALQVETGGQVMYLRRKKIPGVPHHFKCGNMNYGLEHSNSEYVVMMDADMILHPSFLRRLLPHIVNSPDVSFVQIPQSFYNLPLGDPLNDACVLGYDKVLVHRDSMGCASCIGTGALFRRKHLNQIGGFQPQSITEDTTTAYALFKEGYRSVYLNEKLQIGLTPWTFEGYIKQRTRWGQGAMQQFKSTWKVMLGKKSKLNFVLKVLYFWHSGFYFLSIVNMLLVSTMLGALLFRPNFQIGSDVENRQLFASLAYNLILWRLSWLCSWLSVPQSVQSRNRDESTFWWMTPVFFKMIMETLFNYNSTFKFVPTSNIDRNASKGNKSAFVKLVGQLKHVRFHLCYTAVVVTVVLCRGYILVTRHGMDDCRESFYVVGISYFVLTTCAHMMLPVMFILWPTGYKPSERKSLLRYSKDGVPLFSPEDCAPKWYWSVVFYEVISYGTLIFWAGVLYFINSGADQSFCRVAAF